MKKILITLLFIQFIFIAGCDKTNKNNTDKTNSDVFISKYFECIQPENNLIELYNQSDETIELSDYQLKIYKDGSNVSTSNLELSGEIKANDFYLIKYLNNETIEADIALDLRFTGNDAIALFKNDDLLDVVGEIGSPLSFGSDVTLVKKKEYFNGYSKYQPYYYIPYRSDYFEIIKSKDYLTETELLAGPKLTDEDFLKPFKITDSMAGGGVITVRLSSCVDGDTARFTYPSEVGIENGTKVRFFNINTRETMPDNTQEWGVPAKLYTCERLQNARVIQLQSIENNSLYETYDRVLANVWVDGELLNYTIAQKGFTEVAFGSNPLIYKNISYTNWLVDAVNYAKFNKLGLHGEKDPYWDYIEIKPKG